MVQEADTTFAVHEQAYGDNMFGAGYDVQEDISGPVPGENTTEASTFAIDGQFYGEDLSGVAEVPAYLLPGNDVPEDFAGPMSGTNQGLGDWAQCSSNSQCSNGCCSDAAVAGVFKCTPLSGDFDPSICTAV